jgi:hypothetical protein
MRRKDGLYFAPKIRFIDIDPSAPALPSQWVARIDGFYLQPARVLAASHRVSQREFSHLRPSMRLRA